MRNKLWGSGIVAAIATVLASTASAKDPDPSRGVTLEWNAPSECPTKSDVEAHLARLLALRLADFPEAVHTRADIEAVADGSWVLRLTIDNVHGRRERRLKHPSSCAPLAKAAAIVAAIALDPNAAQRVEASAESPEPETRPELPATRPIVEGPGAKGTSLRALRAGLRLQLGADAGELPRAGVVVGGATSVVLARLRLEGTFAYFPTQHREVASVPGVGADFGLWTAGLRLCPILHLTVESQLLFCAGGELGQMRANGVGLDASRSIRKLWAAPVLASALKWPTTASLSALLAFELVLPLQRSEFFVENDGVLHRPGAVSARILAGLELEVP